MNSLPIDIILPNIINAIDDNRNVILSAEPGAGKTTRVPIALKDQQWLSGKKILMLEPRRIAAQRAALFMAQLQNEKVGESIGYRIRGDSKVSSKTKIQILTEGILTRMIQDDPTLPEIGLIIFDEFHERSIHADLGLALALEVQEHLRNDLRILVMSATLDGISLSKLMSDAPIIHSEGKVFPVIVHYSPTNNNAHIEDSVVAAINRALKEEQGDILVFLPGQREIRRVDTLLEETKSSLNIVVHLLFGEAEYEKQQAALNPDPKGRRKIILSTNIAETSVTIEGVRIVIDSGLSRTVRFDSRRGMSGLVTTSVSQSSAHQRMGRAGRQQSGVCYRLWTEHQHKQLPKYSQPEILAADLAPLVMEFAQWENAEGNNLRFLDPPPEAHLTQAKDLLIRLGALTNDGKLTDHGKSMVLLGVHPRLSHMLIKGKEFGIGSLACDVAALLEDRDFLRRKNENDIDLFSRLYALRNSDTRYSIGRERVVKQSERLRNQLGVKYHKDSEEKLGMLLALAYPERVGKRRGTNELRYQMSGNMVASLPKSSVLSKEEYLAIADVDGAGSDVKIFLAAQLTEQDIRTAFDDQIVTVEEVFWNEREESIVSRRITRFGSLELSESLFTASKEKIREEMLNGIKQMGINSLPWNDDSNSIRTRSEWLRKKLLVSNDWLDLSDKNLIETLQYWLAPFLDGISKRSQLSKLDLSLIIRSLFSYQQLHDLDRLAPTHLTVPTGSNIRLDYSNDSQPILAVRLGEMFGETETPTVAGGKVKVLLHLLSPARRPIAVTQDLPSFWKNAYVQVRKDMRGEYPKHYWPENPLEAEPTKKTKRAMEGKKR
ncbi:MAG: ATP-dependent helicase HrpB [Bacteroidota bacterium]|nr:ATP-dependent helicase HrpB [Bacteroidota bacterium]